MNSDPLKAAIGNLYRQQQRIRIWLIQLIAGSSIKIIINVEFYSTVTVMQGANHYFIRTSHFDCDPAIKIIDAQTITRTFRRL
jgi:hypothetical protein